MFMTCTGSPWSWALVGFSSTAIVTVLTVWPVGTSAQQPLQNATFSKDIAPVLQKHCQSCHNPQGGAPMPLLTYDQVRPWAKAIKLQTTRRQMPPWFVEPNVGIQRFKDDPRL